MICEVDRLFSEGLEGCPAYVASEHLNDNPGIRRALGVAGGSGANSHLLTDSSLEQRSPTPSSSTWPVKKGAAQQEVSDR